MDIEWPEDLRATTIQSVLGGEQHIDPDNEILDDETNDGVDVEKVLDQAGWIAKTKLQKESIGIEKDPEYEEYEQNKEGFLKKYHEAILDRAMDRPDMCSISPHALKATPRAMKISLSDGSVFSLKPHQLTGVGEMEHLESREPHGGVLADDMGLGKTVQIMALICRSKYKASIKGQEVHNLVVTPKSLLPMWKEQLAQTRHPRLEVLVYHGPGKADHTYEDFKCCDVVLTTYEAVRQEYKDYQAINAVFRDAVTNETGKEALPKLPELKRQNVPLMTMRWGRVILEEAHQARNTTTATFKAVFFLKAEKRWAITGTPFLNEYTDIHSILKFLRLKPWCVDELFHQYFLRPSKDKMSREILMQLPNKVLVAAFQSMAIRRERGSKFDGAPITDTQDPIIHWIQLRLDDGSRFGRPCSYLNTAITEAETQTRHERFWNRVGENDQDEEEGEKGDIFRKITFMLMAAVHYASPRGKYNDRDAAEERRLFDARTASTHATVGLTEGTSDDTPNPTNREAFKTYVRGLEHGWHSTKIDECVEIIEDRLKDGLGVLSGRIIVFSDWMTCLDILSMALDDKKIRWAALNGKMTLQERSRTIHAFQDETDSSAPDVLLITTKCGSYGLTLTAASTVIMLNSSWTPLTDLQCIARANRIGQTRTVHVYYLHMLQSMEDHKLEISKEKQEKSDRLMDNTRVIKEGIRDDTYYELVRMQCLHTPLHASLTMEQRNEFLQG